VGYTTFRRLGAYTRQIDTIGRSLSGNAMAFNPFTSFQRNQKFWMATLVLLSMLTFVFCSGSAGDMGDWILKRFTPRQASVASINGKGISRSDLYDLRRQRDIANEMMRKCADLAVQRLSEQIKVESDKLNAAKPEQRQQEDFKKRERAVGEWTVLRGELLTRLQQPRFFELGNKLDDTIEFMTWQAQADRLDITLSWDYVRLLVLSEFYGILREDGLYTAAHDARRGNQNISEGFLIKALTDEYRVRLAQLATLTSHPADYFRPVESMRLNHPLLPSLVRAPMSPAMLWDFYKSKRSEFDVKLIPIHVSDFVAKMRVPTEAEELNFFRRFEGDPYDPTSPTPGLLVPAKAKVGFVMADPNSPAYLDQARARLLLPLTAPLLDPLQSATSLAVRYASVDMAYQAELERAYSGLSRAHYRAAEMGSADVVSPLAAWLAKRDARSAAGYVGNLGATLAAQVVGASFPDSFAMAGYLAWGVTQHPQELEAGLQAESRERAPTYGILLASAASPFPVFSVLAADASLSPQIMGPTTLPLAVVRQDIQDILAHNIAEQWARDNMRVVREKLERASSAGNQAFHLALAKYVGQYHLTYGKTQKFYDRFDIAKAPELQPLEQAFRRYVDQINVFEGRDITPERMLKDSDFAKMFFGGDSFTAEGTYRPLPWPPSIRPMQTNMQVRRQIPPGFQVNPAIQADLAKFIHGQDPARPRGAFDLFGFAERPALYWKIDDTVADKPKELAQVRSQVIEGWKFEKAREDVAIPLARTIAADLQETGGAFNNEVLAKEGAKAGHAGVDLPHVAALTPEGEGFQRDYGSFTLPKSTFAYPREDMVQQLLKLYDPAKPLEISSGASDLPIKRQLDAINKELWEKTIKEFKGKSPAGKFVQILTNRPLSEFYVAVVPLPPTASRDDFFAALQRAPWMPMIVAWEQQAMRNPQFRNLSPPSDTLVVRAQKEDGKRVRDAILEQLKTEFKVDVPIDAELRADFDRGG
jgi:hypothetical protein